ncbi:MAG: hypothetical protein L6243_04540 [Candidatus Altiarchaeales archaeon]|nr:hypothetical protein [Candidatus Altiarchaeota archaeon]MCG2782838.1 hypothetical protein [Candidatus Altiarchaeales archaeon]
MVMIRKASGDMEEFSLNKVVTAIVRSGGTPDVADRVIKKLEKKLYEGISTREIYKITFGLLDKEQPSLASRYDLRGAIMRLGPAGFPFETYLGEVLAEHGYKVQLRQNIKGKCVGHEIDIVLSAGDEHTMVECKYHNEYGIYTGLKAALYTYARFLDLEECAKEGKCENFTGVWLATNTKFSFDAKQYSKCRGVRLLGWRYPKGEGIETLIESKGLYPITILRKVDRKSKEMLAKANMMLLKDLTEKSPSEISSKTGIKERTLRDIIEEARGIVVKD